MLCFFYPEGKSPVPVEEEAEWAPEPIWMF